MKKHLFYSLLLVFLLTAVTTLLGVAGFLQIEEQHLNLLVKTLGVKLAVVITLLFGWPFFFRSAPKTKEITTKPIRRSAGSVSLSAPSKNGHQGRLKPMDKGWEKKPVLNRAPEKVALTAPGFFKENARLKNRPLEWDRWLESVAGKRVTWHGTLVEVRRKDDGMLLSMSVCSILECFWVTADLNLADIIASFQEGDFLKVEGVFQGAKAKPSIKAESLNRLDQT